MNEYEKLFAQAKEKLIAAKTLLTGDNPDMAQIKKLQDEAKALEERAEALKAVSGGLDRLSQPVLPVALPTGDGNGTQPAPPAPASAGDVAVKAAYQIMFGEPDSAIKAILTDLHGSDYEAKRWRQRVTFNRWLRDYTNPMIPPEGRAFLWTPEAVKLAIMEGLDVRAMKTVMVEAQDALGGYIVPDDWRADIISRMTALTIMRPRARKITTSRDSVELPVVTGGDGQYRDAVRVTWVDETPTAGTAATNLTYGLEKLPVHTVMAETFLSRNLVEDAAFNIVDWLTQSFAEAQAIDEDNQFLTGDGNGRPQGLLPSSANGLSLTEKVSGAAATLTWDGLIGLTFSIDAQYRQNAVFIGEKASYEVISKLKDSNGQYLWRQTFGDNVGVGGAGTVRTLLGYPTLEQEAMPTATTNTYPLLFGDLSGYVIADRIGMSVERYLDSTTARINQVIYLARRRLGGQCMQTWRFAVQKCATS